MSVMREQSNTASELDEFHFFGEDKPPSENSVFQNGQTKYPYKYRLTPQYLKDTAKVQ